MRHFNGDFHLTTNISNINRSLRLHNQISVASPEHRCDEFGAGWITCICDIDKPERIKYPNLILFAEHVAGIDKFRMKLGFRRTKIGNSDETISDVMRISSQDESIKQRERSANRILQVHNPDTDKMRDQF